MQAAEKYVLGELTPAEFEAFEEHFFDCQECAEDVRAVTMFVSASRQVFLEEQSDKVSIRRSLPWYSRLLAQLRPAFAIPVLAALLLFVGYRNYFPSTIIGEVSVPGQSALNLPSYGLRGGDRLANESSIVQVRAGQSFQLAFDFLSSREEKFDRYTGLLQDQSGRTLVEYRIAADRLQKELSLIVPAGRLSAGEYSLVLIGQGIPAKPGAKEEVARYNFRVEILP